MKRVAGFLIFAVILCITSSFVLAEEIHHAVKHDDIETVKKLVENDPKVLQCKEKEQGWTPLDIAIMNNNVRMVEYLLSKGADANAKYRGRGEGKILNNMTPLYLALNSIGDRTIEIMELLISKGADVNVKCCSTEDTPLHNACKKESNLKIVEFLVSKGADVKAENRHGSTPLHRACRSGQLEIVEFLLSKGAEVDKVSKSDKVTPLWEAAVGGRKEVMELLLSKGANINTINNASGTGVTPLHAAAKEGHKEMTEFLLSKGANINAVTKTGLTPLHLAIFSIPESLLTDVSAQEEVAVFLISQGADISIRGSLNELFANIQPIHAAVIMENFRLVELLLSKGADANSQSKIGTPLFYSALKGYKDMIELLISKGADINAKDGFFNMTPLQRAKKNNKTEMVDFLIQKGAKE
jgi:ankyrin repeat protein